MRDKSYVVAILAEHGVLRAETLRFAHEVRSPQAVGLPEPNTHDKTLTAKLGKAIASLAQDTIDVDELEDAQYAKLEARAQEKLRRKQDVVRVKGKPEAEQSEANSEPIDLVALLKQRLAQPKANDQARKGKGKGKGNAASARQESGGSQSALENKAKRDLYARAKSLGIEGRSQMSKQDLLKAIRAANG